MTARDEHALAVLFRQESGRLVATLTRFFGVGDLALAEDVAQETLVVALQAWSRGLPPDPRAWLFHVAKNRARDMMRRRRVRRGADDTFDPDDLAADTTTVEDVDADVLRMMFSCCHPTLTEDTQTALILRLVCGFGTNEVALAFFSEPIGPAQLPAHRLAGGDQLDGATFDIGLQGVQLGVTGHHLLRQLPEARDFSADVVVVGVDDVLAQRFERG